MTTLRKVSRQFAGQTTRVIRARTHREVSFRRRRCSLSFIISPDFPGSSYPKQMYFIGSPPPRGNQRRSLPLDCSSYSRRAPRKLTAEGRNLNFNSCSPSTLSLQFSLSQFLGAVHRSRPVSLSSQTSWAGYDPWARRATASEVDRIGVSGSSLTLLHATGSYARTVSIANRAKRF